MPIIPETYPGSSVFINKLGITEEKQLATAEASFSLLYTEDYRSNPIPGRFDLAHLQAIHRHLFQSIYSWAGELRGYDIRKGICEFTPHQKLEYYADKVYKGLSEEGYLFGYAKQRFVERLAYYYDLTNRLHPFPEGNGRTQRLFIEHLATTAGYRVNWDRAQPWQIVEVAIQSFEGRFEPTVLLFEDIISTRG